MPVLHVDDHGLRVCLSDNRMQRAAVLCAVERLPVLQRPEGRTPNHSIGTVIQTVDRLGAAAERWCHLGRPRVRGEGTPRITRKPSQLFNKVLVLARLGAETGEQGPLVIGSVDSERGPDLCTITVSRSASGFDPGWRSLQSSQTWGNRTG